MYKSNALLKPIIKKLLDAYIIFCNVFNKSVLAIQYLLANLDFMEHKFLHMEGFISITDHPNEDKDFIHFAKSENIFYKCSTISI